MTQRLALVSHGSTSAMREGRFSHDEPLDEIGVRKTADFLPLVPEIDQAWSSPSLAAIETAQLLRLDPKIDPSLRGCDFGRWKGLYFKDVINAETPAYTRWRSDPSAAPHGGESIEQLMARLAPWLTERMRCDANEMLIADGLTVRALVAVALAVEPKTVWHIDVAPLSVVRLSCTDGHWRVLFQS